MNYLHEAAKIGIVTDVMRLIQQGQDINGFDETQQSYATPLIYAAKFGHLPVVAILLEHGADPNLAKPNRFTPLMWAAERGFVDIASLLLENGSEVNTVARDETAVRQAIWRGDVKMLNLLIHHGADVNTPTVGRANAINLGRGKWRN